MLIESPLENCFEGPKSVLSLFSQGIGLSDLIFVKQPRGLSCGVLFCPQNRSFVAFPRSLLGARLPLSSPRCRDRSAEKTS